MIDLQAIAAVLESDLSLRKTLDDGTGVVVDLRKSRVLALNSTGMFLVEQIAQGAESVEDLIAALTDTFAVDQATAQHDVQNLIQDLWQRLAYEEG